VLAPSLIIEENMITKEQQYLETFLLNQRSDYTFKYNQKLGRHGWLRLTPAYSVKLVKEIIDNIPADSFILDPFSGTATTGIVAAEHGLSAHCLDINPFLIWLGNAKC
jgi:DNA modification methylase